jgi:excisionase family DNA binding protein
MTEVDHVPTTRVTEWIGIEQLSEELGIPVRTIYNWRTLGKGPRGHRIGRHVRFKRSDVDAWLETLADPGDAA